MYLAMVVLLLTVFQFVEKSEFQAEEILVNNQEFVQLSSLKEAFIDADNDGNLDRQHQRVRVAARAIYDAKLISDEYFISYIFDDTRAGMIYAPENTFTFEAGDSLHIFGEVFSYHGMPEIIVDSISVIPSQKKTIKSKELSRETNEFMHLLGFPVSGEFILLSKEKLDQGSIRMKVSLIDGATNEYYVFIRSNQVSEKGFDVDKYDIGERLSVTGVLGYYEENYGYGSYQLYPESPSDIRLNGVPKKLLEFILFGFLATVIGVVVWNYSLRKQIDRHTGDISKALDEKTVLLNEIHHRVKNNLAVVSGFLQLEMMKKDYDPDVKKVLDENIMRIKSMGYIHEQLYKSKDFSSINMHDYINVLVREISSTFSPTDKNIQLEIHCEPISLNMNQAIPCALTINELLSNAYKHAFSGRNNGCIQIHVFEKENTIFVKVMDDGIGLPKNDQPGYTDSLGMLLVHQFVAQLESELNYKNTVGSTFSFQFKKENSDSYHLAQV